jgi:hypothetical protein
MTAPVVTGVFHKQERVWEVAASLPDGRGTASARGSVGQPVDEVLEAAQRCLALAKDLFVIPSPPGSAIVARREVSEVCGGAAVVERDTLSFTARAQ